MPTFLENILVMILTIVVLLAGGYLVLLFLNFWLKIKSGSREQEGLTDMWIASQTEAADKASGKSESEDDPDTAG